MLFVFPLLSGDYARTYADGFGRGGATSAHEMERVSEITEGKKYYF